MVVGRGEKMDSDVKKQIILLNEKIKGNEKEIIACHEGIRATKVAIHHLSKGMKSLAKAVSLTRKTQGLIAEAQKNLLETSNNHQAAIEKIVGVAKPKKRDYIS